MNFIGVDIGTTMTKSVLVNDQARVLAEAQQPSTLYSEHATWAEQDPHQWWENTCIVIRKVLSNVNADSVAAIGISGMVAP